MAKALALRKALDWAEIYRRRQVIARILSVMQETGEISRGALGADWDGHDVLRRVIDDRRALSNPTPAEQRITEVLVWIYRDRPTRPGGLERRRMKALQDAYQKRGFAPVEAEALQAVIESWQASGEPAKEQAAEKFQQMLASQEVDWLEVMNRMEGVEDPEAEEAEDLPDPPSVDDVSLTGDVRELVRQEMQAFEDAYEAGMVRIARAARTMVNMINGPDVGTTGSANPALAGYDLEAPDEKLFVDHPHIYQYVSLLGYRYEMDHPEKFEEVRNLIIEGVYALRHRKFTLYFLRLFGRKTAINPVMAVETERLTKEQHEREMREANDERVRNAQKLMVRVFRDYLQSPADYLDEDDPQFDTQEEVQDYIRAKLIHPMQDLIEDPTFGQHARDQLKTMRELAADHDAQDTFFRATAE
jgi:hypothetical protein